MSFKSKLKEIVFPRHRFNKIRLGPYSGIWIYQGPQMFKRTVVYYKAWEKEVTRHMKRKISKGDTIMIVGAHVGIHALYAAKLVGKTGKVIAFEPWPENFEMLQKNKERNGFDHLVVEQMAMSDRVGTIAMETGKNDGNHHIADVQDSADNITVKTTTVDQYCADHKMWPEMILVDVEGFELEVLAGTCTVIKEFWPEFILEHHDELKPGISVEIKKWLDQQNYMYHEIERHIYASSKG